MQYGGVRAIVCYSRWMCVTMSPFTKILVKVISYYTFVYTVFVFCGFSRFFVFFFCSSFFFSARNMLNYWLSWHNFFFLSERKNPVQESNNISMRQNLQLGFFSVCSWVISTGRRTYVFRTDRSSPRRSNVSSAWIGCFLVRQSGRALGRIGYTCYSKNRIAYVTVDTVYRDNYCHFIFSLSLFVAVVSVAFSVWMVLRCLVIILSWFAKRMIEHTHTHTLRKSINHKIRTSESGRIVFDNHTDGCYQFCRLYVCNKHRLLSSVALVENMSEFSI